MGEKNGEKELSRTHCRLIELIMNIYNYPLQSQNFQWSNMWDFCFQPAWNSFPSLHPQRGENIKHVILPRWQPASRQMGDTCKPDLWSQRNFKIGFAWSDVALLQALWKSPQPGLLPALCPALPACVLWNFNWIVNDTEQSHNTWETSKNQSGGALFLTATKQKTLGNWQVQAARPG